MLVNVTVILLELYMLNVLCDCMALKARWLSTRFLTLVFSWDGLEVDLKMAQKCRNMST
jgi:hypothetical protein